MSYVFLEPRTARPVEMASSAIYYDRGQWHPSRADEAAMLEGMVLPDGSLGEVTPPLCPRCSYLSEGKCVWCPEEENEIPECANCIGRVPREAKWYRSPQFLGTVIATVAATVISTILLARIGYR